MLRRYSRFARHAAVIGAVLDVSANAYIKRNPFRPEYKPAVQIRVARAIDDDALVKQAVKQPGYKIVAHSGGVVGGKALCLWAK